MHDTPVAHQVARRREDLQGGRLTEHRRLGGAIHDFGRRRRRRLWMMNIASSFKKSRTVDWTCLALLSTLSFILICHPDDNANHGCTKIRGTSRRVHLRFVPQSRIYTRASSPSKSFKVLAYRYFFFDMEKNWYWQTMPAAHVCERSCTGRWWGSTRSHTHVARLIYYHSREE